MKWLPSKETIIGDLAFLFALLNLILMLVARANAQGDAPPPCSPNSPLYSECQSASPNCQPCWQHSCYEIDVNWNVICNEYCDGQDIADHCNPNLEGRTDVASQFVSCSYNPGQCPGYNNYAWQIKDITFDTCDGTTCNIGFTIQCHADCSGFTELRQDQPKRVLAGAGACGSKIQRLDRFGPPVNPPKPIAIPAGLLLHRRYEVLLAQARPGATCIRTKKFQKFHKVRA